MEKDPDFFHRQAPGQESFIIRRVILGFRV